tara:strand:+ start:323 stop:796 length:474 start_codon:yes stop_codon:yes gene_type:complete
MQKLLLTILSSLFLFACTSNNTNFPPQELSGLEENKINITFSDPVPPKWFVKQDYENFDYIIKNSEMSSSKYLAESKNLLISKVLLANKIQESFMTTSDQENLFNSIRNASSKDQINKYMNNSYVNKIISGYTVINNETIKYQTGFINYIYITRIKK